MDELTTKPVIAHLRESDGEKQSLESHLQEVGDIAAAYAAKIGLSNAGRLLGLLHDFGKYSKQFQDYIGSATGELDRDDVDYVDATALKGKVDHSSAGAQYIWKVFRQFGTSGQGELTGQILSLCIASHHSGLIDCIDKNNVQKYMDRMNKPGELTHLAECSDAADPILLDLVNRLATSETSTELFGKICDVYAAASSKIGYFNLGFLTRFLFSCLVDADRLNSAEFELPERQAERLARKNSFSWEQGIDRIEKRIKSFKNIFPVDSIRQNISNRCLEKSKEKQGIYTLTVPTGGGKTYASLRYALHHAALHKLSRIIYIVPYTSIIDQNAIAIREVLEEEGDEFPWVLEHHSNLEPEQQTWKHKLASENWDSPIILTTMVQFLEACFAGGTRSVRRLHQLANSVLIFDEIQTLPIKCTHIFCNALNYLVDHCGTTAVLCTATQPLLNKLNSPEKGQLDIPEGNELAGAEEVDILFDELNRVDIHNCFKAEGWSVSAISELATGELAERGSCLVIVNTKAWAQKLYQLCLENVDGAALFHLSTNQCPAHRKALLEEIKARLKSKLPVLCISTQLIEAGVDISAATVIRFLAGLDSVAQAAGRCNRHGELKDVNGEWVKGRVFVVNPDLETTGMLEDIEVGKRSAERVLREGFSNLVAPDAIRQYFKYYFFDRSKDMSYEVDASKLGRSDTLLNLLSDNDRSPVSYKDRVGRGRAPLLSQAFMEAGKQFKAIDAPTQAIIVPYDDGKRIIGELSGGDRDMHASHFYPLLRQAQKYSVNVFPNTWEKLKQANGVFEIQPGYGVYFLGQQFYDEHYGLNEAGGLLEPLICE